MATSSSLNILRIPARLVLTPTDLTTTFPYGGTALGMSRETVFEFGQRQYVETAEEWGGAPTRVFALGEHGMLKCILRSWDADAIGAVWPTYVAGTSGAPTVVPDVNGSNRAGKVVSGAVIMVCPIARDQSPFVLLYNAMPLPAEASAFRLSRKTEAGLEVAWHAAPGSDGRPYALGKLEDLTL